MDTKQKILESALAELKTKGRSGARLQSIADHCGVNKAMIHYYFNTKKELCDKVFEDACNKLAGDLLTVLEADMPLFEKIEAFSKQAIEQFDEQSELLDFIIHELNINESSEAAEEILFQLAEFDRSILDKQLQEAASNYEIARVESRQLLATIISLCLFPYLGKPFFKSILQMDEEAYFSFLKKRKEIVPDTVINWLVT